MSGSGRTRGVTIAFALTIGSQGCMVNQPLPSDVTPVAASWVHVHSVVPFELTRRIDSLRSIRVCCVTSVQGRLLRVAGDTFVINHLPPDSMTADAVRIPRQREVVTIVRTPTTQVSLRRVDMAKTAELFLGLAVVLLGFLGFVSSMIKA